MNEKTTLWYLPGLILAGFFAGVGLQCGYFAAVKLITLLGLHL